jgi:hypothetical protein
MEQRATAHLNEFWVVVRVRGTIAELKRNNAKKPQWNSIRNYYYCEYKKSAEANSRLAEVFQSLAFPLTLWSPLFGDSAIIFLT